MSILSGQGVDPELARLRDSIDNFDAALIHLLAERFRCTQRVGELFVGRLDGFRRLELLRQLFGREPGLGAGHDVRDRAFAGVRFVGEEDVGEDGADDVDVVCVFDVDVDDVDVFVGNVDDFDGDELS